LNSYVQNINNKLGDYTTNDSLNMTLSIKNTITENAINKLADSLNSFASELAELKKQVNKIETCPEKFIMVKAQRSGMNKLIDKLSEFFYKLFHQKQIRLARKAAEEEKIRLAKEEEERKAAEVERLKREQEEKELEEQRKKKETRSKINNLLKK